MPSSAAELITVTMCSPASVVSCSRGCKPSRTQLPVLSLGQISTRDTDTVSIALVTKTAAYSFRDGRVGVQVSARYPSYLSTYCIPTSSHDSRCHLRSAISEQLSVQCTTTNYGDHSFAVSGPVLWNTLSTALLSVFRRWLKTFFMTEATDSV